MFRISQSGSFHIFSQIHKKRLLFLENNSVFQHVSSFLVEVGLGPCGEMRRWETKTSVGIDESSMIKIDI